MEIVDFFRFPVTEPVESNLFKLTESDLHSSLNLSDNSKVKHALIALFDSSVIDKTNHVKVISRLSHTKNFSFAYMPELSKSFGENQINAAFEMGCRSIVFHPYLQKINLQCIDEVKRLSSFAASLGMIVSVCCAYGSRYIFQYSPLKIVVELAEIIKTPIVIVHGGGAKVIDALLIAESFPNVYLETSFSLQYWLGSSVEKDFAFAIRKLGVERCMFGSDSPFMNIDNAISAHLDFCKKHGFSHDETSKLMGETAKSLLGLN